MTQTKKDLAEKIEALAAENWKDTKEPLLLSRLGPKIKELGFDYKVILEGQGLRHFVASEIPTLTVAQHPSQYAKVGIHPSTETFSYDDASTEPKQEPSDLDRLRKSRRAFYGFIQAISELPPEEIEGVHIPARVIVRLLEGK